MMQHTSEQRLGDYWFAVAFIIVGRCPPSLPQLFYYELLVHAHLPNPFFAAVVQHFYPESVASHLQHDPEKNSHSYCQYHATNVQEVGNTFPGSNVGN